MDEGAWVQLAWVNIHRMKVPLLHQVRKVSSVSAKWWSLTCHPENVFWREGLTYLSKSISNTTFHMYYNSMAQEQKSPALSPTENIWCTTIPKDWITLNLQSVVKRRKNIWYVVLITALFTASQIFR